MKFLIWFSERGGKVHELPTKLEVATDSEESEDEDEEKSKKKGSQQTLVTVKMVNGWNKSLTV